MHSPKEGATAWPKTKGGEGFDITPKKNPNPAMKRIMLNTVSTYHKLVTSLEKPWVPGCEKGK